MKTLVEKREALTIGVDPTSKLGRKLAIASLASSQALESESKGQESRGGACESIMGDRACELVDLLSGEWELFAAWWVGHLFERKGT